MNSSVVSPLSESSQNSDAPLFENFATYLKDIQPSLISAAQSPESQQLVDAAKNLLVMWATALVQRGDKNDFSIDDVAHRFLLECASSLSEDMVVRFFETLRSTPSQLDYESREGAFDLVYSGIKYGLTNLMRRFHFADIIALQEKLDTIDFHAPLEVRYGEIMPIKEALRQILDAKEFSHGSGSHDFTKTTSKQPRFTSADLDTVYVRNVWISRGEWSLFLLDDILQKIRATEQAYHISQFLGTVDTEKLHEQRLIYGAKGANLLVLQDVMARLAQSQFAQHVENLSLPEFQLVPANLYRRWRAGEDITSELRLFYESAILTGGVRCYSK